MEQVTFGIGEATKFAFATASNFHSLGLYIPRSLTTVDPKSTAVIS
jgi:hypothetical protein